ncbi:MAG TPA: hypothetical protein VGR62_04155 [Candidatus Binatia bacterium]|jgi:hypothetical protein|nr:hypothetical protein [Candidatus Binatia bacterium]
MGMRRMVMLCGALVGALGWSAADALGPDAYGYQSIASTEPGGPVVDALVDIAGTGTRVTFVLTDFSSMNADDGTAFDLPLTSLNGGAGFPFYGSPRDTVHMTSNGFLGFTFLNVIATQLNQCLLPNVADPSDGIAVLWDDLVSANPPDATRGGFHQAFSTCPYAQGGTGECVVFEWYRSRHFGSALDQAFTFQAVLYDSGNVLMIYRDNPEQGSGSTTGIETIGGYTGLTHACDMAASIPTNHAILIQAPADGRVGLAEIEPNDEPASATTLTAGRCAGGSILAPDTADVFRLAGTTTDERLFAYVDTQFAGAAYDATLEAVVGSGGTAIAEDDDSGPADSPAIAGVPLTLGGDVFLRVTPSAMVPPLGPYALMTFVARPGDVTPETEPNDAFLEARPMLSPVVAGDVQPFELDHFTVDAEVGDVITAIVDADPDDDGENTRMSVSVLGPNGSPYYASSDSGTDRPATAVGRAVVLVAGKQIVQVRRTVMQGDSSYQMAVLVNCAPACADGDGDGTCDGVDNCAGLANDQADGDGDGLGDACDACPADAVKAAPATCGCGAADADANANGVVDCLANPELRERLDRLTDALNALTKTKGKKKPNPTADEARTRLETVTGYLRSAPPGLTLLDGAVATQLADEIEGAVTRAAKGGAKFGKKKKKALAAVQKARDAVAP